MATVKNHTGIFKKLLVVVNKHILLRVGSADANVCSMLKDIHLKEDSGLVLTTEPLQRTVRSGCRSRYTPAMARMMLPEMDPSLTENRGLLEMPHGHNINVNLGRRPIQRTETIGTGSRKLKLCSNCALNPSGI